METHDKAGPATPIRVNEITGLWTFLSTIDWSERWFIGLGAFHLVCIILTIVLRKTGVGLSIYFGLLVMIVFCAEYINEWAASNWSLFAKQQYFDSNGLFISVVFSMPLLMNCMVIVVSWLWDVGHLISDAKRLKVQKINRVRKSSEKEKSDGSSSQNGASGSRNDEKEEDGEGKKER